MKHWIGVVAVSLAALGAAACASPDNRTLYPLGAAGAAGASANSGGSSSGGAGGQKGSTGGSANSGGSPGSSTGGSVGSGGGAGSGSGSASGGSSGYGGSGGFGGGSGGFGGGSGGFGGGYGGFGGGYGGFGGGFGGYGGGYGGYGGGYGGYGGGYGASGGSGGTGGTPPGGGGPTDACPGVALTLSGTGTDPRTASVTGDNTSLTNTADGSCAWGYGGHEAIYSFTPDIAGVAHVAVTGSFDVAVYVRTDCSAASSEVACADNNGAGSGEDVTFTVAAGTTYFVFVDGSSASDTGSFQLDLTITKPGAESSCPGKVLTLSGSGSQNRTATATGDTTGDTSDATGSCTGGNQNDAVYAITPDVDGTMTLKLSDPGWDGGIYVRTTCDTASSEVACVDDNAAGQDETLTFQVTAGTTYYAFVDGYDIGYGSEAGPYTLDATLVPAAAEEKCPGADLSFSGSPPAASASGDLAQRWPDYTGSCGANNQAPDAVYHVVAPQTGKMTITVTPSGFDALLYVRTDCLASGSELTCQNQAGTGSPETAVVDATAGSDYYIFVDSADTTGGTYTLDVAF